MRSIIIIAFLLILNNLLYAQKKYVAVTMDDLCYAFNGGSFGSVEAASDSLLNSITRLGVPVTVFVNEKSFIEPGETDRRLALYRKWIDNPLITIGNHTYSHLNYAETDLSTFEDNIIQGEALSRDLLKKAGKELKYFRFPFNCTGKDSASRAEIFGFLNRRGYVIAPFTVESGDYMYNAVYRRLIKQGKTKAADAILNSYIKFTSELLIYFEDLSVTQYGREIAQIYLCHTNQLNAAAFTKLILELKHAGYSFISLDKALGDEIYKSPDYYTQKYGVSWYYRWIKNKDERIKLMRKEPEDPEIEREYNNLIEHH